MTPASRLCEQFVQAVGVKTDHHLIVYYDGGRCTAVIGADQLEDVFLLGPNITLFELDTSILEVSLYRPAGRSTRLREYDDFGGHAMNG